MYHPGLGQVKQIMGLIILFFYSLYRRFYGKGHIARFGGKPVIVSSSPSR